MRTRPLFFALAAALLTLPCHAFAQSTSAGSGETSGQAVRRTMSRNPGSRPANPALALGFSFGMTPGRGNAYGYPYVRTVSKGSNAERAGLAVGDTILTIDGRDARQGRLFPEARPGARYVVRVRRNGEERELTYTFAPAAPAAKP
jgi:S1-C subfamily serine protease